MNKLGAGTNVWDFVQGICEIAKGHKGHELMALRCLNKGVSDQEMAMDFSLYEEELTEFMESVMELPDDRADVGVFGARLLNWLLPVVECISISSGQFMRSLLRKYKRFEHLLSPVNAVINAINR